jgi:hypothetical protein
MTTPRTEAVRIAFQDVRRRHVAYPEQGADSVDAAIASALHEAEDAILAIEAEAAAGPREPVHVHDYGAARIPCSRPECEAAPGPRDEGLREALDQIAARTDDEEVMYWVAKARTAMQRAALAKASE